MAFDYFAEDEKKNEEDANQGQGQPLGQESPVVQGSGPAQGGAGSTSGSFTNLQKYLDANSSLNFGQQVAGKVQGKIDEAGQGQNEAETGFKSKADQNTVKSNSDLISRVNTDPSGIVSNQGDFDEFKKERDAMYGGPKNFADDNDDYTNAYSKTNDAYNTSEQTKDEGGRKAYLNQEYGSGKGRYDYTPGMQKLDNFLIQNDQGSKDAFAKTQESGQNVKKNFDALSNRLGEYANQAQQTTAQARSASRGALGLDDNGNFVSGNPIEQTVNQAKTQADTYNQQREKQYNDYMNALSSRQGLAQYGVAQGTQLFGLGTDKSDMAANRFVSESPEANYQTAATQEQLARVNALSQLAGKDNTFLDPAMTGTYDPSKAVNFNSADLLAQAKAKQALYDRDVNEKNINVQWGGFDPDSGRTTGGTDKQSLLEALDREGKSAAFATDPVFRGGYSDQSSVARYNDLVNKLKDFQDRYNYNDTADGGVPAGSWQNYYGKYGGVPEMPTASLPRNTGVRSRM